MPAPHRTGRTSFPDQRTLLTWLFGGRLLVALVTLIAGALVWTTAPQASFLASVAVIVALVITAYGASMLRTPSWEPGPVFLTVQFVVDLLLITLLARFFGPTGGVAPALYVLLIAAYAVVVPIAFGIAMALAASAVFAIDVIRQSGSDAALWAQVVVFNLVFAVVASLGHRLRKAGLEAHTLEYELERVRLEADVILRNIRSGVLTVDPGGRLAFINPTAQQLLHLEGVIGEPVLDSVKHRSSELWAALVAGIRHGRKVSRGEGVVLHHEEGRQFPIGLSTTTFQQRPEAASSVTAIFTDISDSKQLQELQLRAERLEAVAELSASLAHEIRNPLASIRSSVEQLARSRHAGDDERTLASLIVRESDRLSRLLSEFLDFSRVRASKAEPLDLHAVTTAAVAVVRPIPTAVPSPSWSSKGSAPWSRATRTCCTGPSSTSRSMRSRRRARSRCGWSSRWSRCGPPTSRAGSASSIRSASASATTGPACRRRSGSGCSSPSSAAGRAAAGSGSPSCSAPSPPIGARSSSIRSSVPAPPSPSICPPPGRRRTSHESEAKPAGRR